MPTNSGSNIVTADVGKVLQGAGLGVQNAFSTATYPSIATGTGKILRADGTNWVATTATYPDTAGTNGNVLTSDGTNWSSSTLPASTDYRTAKLIVSAGGSTNGANYTTIASAMTAAASGETIFVQPGTYVENLTLKPGVSIAGFNSGTPWFGDTAPATIIRGIHTLASGAFFFSNVKLQLNSGASAIFTGSSTTNITCQSCIISYYGSTSAFVCGAAGIVNLWNCIGDDSAGTSTTQILSLDAVAATARVYNCSFNVTGNNFASISSSGGMEMYNSSITNSITTSGTATFLAYNSLIGVASLNRTLTLGGTGTNTIYNCIVSGGTASAISIGTGATLTICNSTIQSSNTNAITGAGTIKYNGLSFAGTSSTINTTTQSVAGTLQGSKTTAPTAGFLGEEIRATVAFASAVTSTTTTVTNVTSISLTAGVWNVAGIVMYTGMTTSTGQSASVNTSSATIGTVGDNAIRTGFTSTTAQDFGASIPSWRLTITGTTTVYLVGSAIYSAGTGKLYGRISATRVG